MREWDLGTAGESPILAAAKEYGATRRAANHDAERRATIPLRREHRDGPVNGSHLMREGESMRCPAVFRVVFPVGLAIVATLVRAAVGQVSGPVGVVRHVKFFPTR